MNKPDPALWQLTCDTFSSAPNELVFIDNSPRLVRSAQEFGINTVLYQNTPQVITDVNAFVSPR
jgi:putative hydrolase of the HAD superfamily